MDTTTALIIALILYLADRRDRRALDVARLALELAREQARTRAALAVLERRRELARRLLDAFRREVSPAMQRARLDPPVEVAGLLGRLSEEVEDGVRDP